MRLLDTRLGKQIVADEDRMLLEQCGYVDAHTRGIFLSARIACAIALPAAVALVGGETVRTHLGAWVALSVIAGFMLPKTYVRRRAAAPPARSTRWRACAGTLAVCTNAPATSLKSALRSSSCW